MSGPIGRYGGTATWGTATPGTFVWGGSALLPTATQGAYLVFYTGGTAVGDGGTVIADACADTSQANTHAAVFADNWLQEDTVTATLGGTALPASMAYGNLVTLQQVDPQHGALEGPFGRYRMAGVVAPQKGSDHLPYVRCEAHDWLRALLARTITTSGIVGVSAPVAALQLVDMLRGVQGGPVAADPDLVTVANSTFGETTWWQTWEGTIFAVLWYVSGSTLANQWVVAEGALTDLENAAHFLVEFTDPDTGRPNPRWYPYARMYYDQTTTWRQLLTELCAPRVPGRTSFGMQPLWACYDASGVLHLRRWGERWARGWGYKPTSDSTHDLAYVVPVQEYSVRQVPPQYDRVIVTMTYLLVAANPLLIYSDVHAATSWYTWRADLERSLEEPLSVGGIVGGVPGSLLSTVALADAYVTQIAQAMLLRYLMEAYEMQLTLGQAWYYPQLGTDVQVYDGPSVSIGTTLWQATTPFNGKGGTWSARWRTDL